MGQGGIVKSGPRKCHHLPVHNALLYRLIQTNSLRTTPTTGLCHTWCTFDGHLLISWYLMHRISNIISGSQDDKASTDSSSFALA